MTINNIFKIVKIVYIVFKMYEQYRSTIQTTRRRRWWVREMNLSRDQYGFFNRSFLIMKSIDKEHFKKATRFNVENFEVLFILLKEKLTKQSRRKAIEPECRLALTLMYLAHGCSMQVLAWNFKMGVSTVREIVLETCCYIWNELNGVYVANPNMDEFVSIADSFYKKCGMPNCLGAIDGKHVNITCPRNSGSLYYNYKGHHSLVLLAACDAAYTFTAVDVGSFGSQSDGGIFSHSGFGKLLMKGELPLPTARNLPNTNIKFPFYFVGDSAFPLQKNLMRPYPNRNLPNDKDKEMFNKKLSRARIRIENTFGILVNRWRILRTTINLEPKNAEKIILSTIVLHNFAMLQKIDHYCPDDYVDNEVNGVMIPGLWRQNEIQLRTTSAFNRNRSSAEAFSLRDNLKSYLNQI